jgi:hypothetical protein
MMFVKAHADQSGGSTRTNPNQETIGIRRPRRAGLGSGTNQETIGIRRPRRRGM